MSASEVQAIPSSTATPLNDKRKRSAAAQPPPAPTKRQRSAVGEQGAAAEDQPASEGNVSSFPDLDHAESAAAALSGKKKENRDAGKSPKKTKPASTASGGTKAKVPDAKASAMVAAYQSKPTKASTVRAPVSGPPPGEVQTLKSRMADKLGWHYNGLKPSLLLWAAGPGSQSFGAGKSSTSTKNSLFTEQVLKYLFARHLNLRQGIEQLVQSTRETTANQQIPGYTDDGLIGLDFRMLSGQP